MIIIIITIEIVNLWFFGWNTGAGLPLQSGSHTRLFLIQNLDHVHYKGIMSQVSINTLDQYPIARSTLHQYSVNILANTWSTLDQDVGRQSVEDQLIFAGKSLIINWCIWVGRH